MSSSPVIAISGASAGIGLAIAERFAHKGWNVSIAARSEQTLQQLQERWTQKFPQSTLHVMALDLSTSNAPEQWASALKQVFDQLNVLVHNLGKFEVGRLLEGPMDQLEGLLATNVLSAHRLTRTMLPLLTQVQNAQLITIGSVGTTDWPPHLASYSLSKYLLEGWHREVAKELSSHGIRSTLIRPGATFTRSWEGIEVDPETLLSAERVAAYVDLAVTNSSGEQLEEITIRPKQLN